MPAKNPFVPRDCVVVFGYWHTQNFPLMGDKGGRSFNYWLLVAAYCPLPTGYWELVFGGGANLFGCGSSGLGCSSFFS